jgi:hypothetical protein
VKQAAAKKATFWRMVVSIQQSLVAATGLILMAGCVATPTNEQVAAADCGQQQVEQAIRRWCDQYLKDPESAKVQFPLPLKKGSYVTDRGVGPYFAWEQDTFINAKNSYGGYTGARPYIFYLRNASVVWVYPPR